MITINMSNTLLHLLIVTPQHKYVNNMTFKYFTEKSIEFHHIG